MFSKFKIKWLWLLLALSALLVVGITGSMAFLTTNSNQVVNTFSPAQMSCEVEEESFLATEENEFVKKNVCVKNTGDAPAYIRVKLLPYWYAKDENVVVAKAAWKLDFKPGEDWLLGTDGFYYYTKPVLPEECTGILIELQTMKIDPVTRYRPVLEIIASCVQAEPAEAVEDWSNDLYTVSNGQLTDKKKNN